MILGRCTPVVAATTLILTLAGCSDDGQRPGKAPGKGPSAAPPPTLAEGALAVAVRQGIVGRSAHLDEPGLLVTEDLFLTVDQPDNSLTAYSRDGATEQWRVPLPRDEVTDEGSCFDPMLSGPDQVIVFIGTGCDLLVAYDLATGTEVHREHVIQTYIDDKGVRHQERTSPGDYAFHASVTGAVALDGRVWYVTHDEIGYVDGDAHAVSVFEADDLGLVDNARERSHPVALGVRAEDHLLVAELLVVDQRVVDDFASRSEWLGITVEGEEEPTARIAWRLDERDGSTLGVQGLAKRAPILIPTDQPGAIVALA